MKTKFATFTKFTLSAGLLVLAVLPSLRAAPLGTAFTYQGRLYDGSVPASGFYEFRLGLYDNAVSGSLVPATSPAINPTALIAFVTNGLFTAQLDFGVNVFNGNARFLQVEVRTNDPALPLAPFTALLPRQELKPVPYALFASNAAVAVRATTADSAGNVVWPDGLVGLPAGFADGVDNDHVYSAGTGLVLSGVTPSGGTFSLDTAFTDARYWRLGGNSGTTFLNFLGTTDSGQSLEFRAANSTALRLVPSSGTPNVVGGSGINTSGGAQGAAIGGGGQILFVGPGAEFQPNSVTDDFGTVGGGLLNRAGDNAGSTTSAAFASVGGGLNNIAAGFAARIGGGTNNLASGTLSSVGGGARNQSASIAGTISGGQQNTNYTPYGTIGGGALNSAAAPFSATISGGYANSTLGQDSTIGGGSYHFITSNHVASTISGGQYNALRSDGGNFDPTLQRHPSGANISGGVSNAIVASWFGTVAGGLNNLLTNAFDLGPGWYPSDFGVIGGGANNTLYRGYGSVIAGGASNRVENTYASINGGFANWAYGRAAVVAGGVGNWAGARSAVLGGTDNNAGDEYSSVLGGRSNHVNASFAAVTAGELNSINYLYDYSTAAGQGSVARRAHSETHGIMFSQPGDGQCARYFLTNSTPGTTTRLLSGPVVPVGSAISFSMLVSAKAFGDASAGFEVKGLIRNYGTSVALVGTPTVTILGRDGVLAAATVTTEVNASALTFRVSSGTALNVRWVGCLQTSEVSF